MYYLKAEQSFDSAHFLKNYEGKCSNLHGHRWRVIAEIAGMELSSEKQTEGMLMDFGEIKEELKKLCDEMDHCLIYEKDSLKPSTIRALKEEEFRLVEVSFRPTAENFACYFFKRLKEKGMPVHRVEVYETPTNCAVYEE